MSDLPSSEQSLLDSHLRLSTEADARGYPRVCALSSLTDLPEMTPRDSSRRVASRVLLPSRLDLTHAPKMTHKNHLALSGICQPEPVYDVYHLDRADAQFFIPSFPYAAQELSPGILHVAQPAPYHLSVSEDATFARSEEVHISQSVHTVIPPEGHSFGEAPSLSPPKDTGSVIPLAQVPHYSHYTPYSFGPDNMTQAGCFEHQLFNRVGPRSALMEGTGSVPTFQLNVAHTDHVRDEQNHQEAFCIVHQTLEGHTQEKMISPSYGLNLSCNESLFEHQRTCQAEKEVATTACEYASLCTWDEGVLEALILENPKKYNQDWSLLHMIAFNGILIDEYEIICRWVEYGMTCGDRIKGKDVKGHLHLRHGIAFDSQSYKCRWHECFTRPMKKSSLERHFKERHIPVKWACPTCEKTFSRKTSLMVHFERCKCGVQSLVACTRPDDHVVPPLKDE